MRAAADDAEILSSLVRIVKYHIPLEGLSAAALTAAGDEDDLELAFAKAGFTAADPVLVGSGAQQHVNFLGAIPGDASPIPVVIPIPFSYAIGAAVKELAAVNMGYIEEQAVSFSGSSTIASVGAANAGGRIWYGKPDVGELTASWGQRASSLENIASAYGIHEGNVKGDGTTNDPYRLLGHPSSMGTQRDFAYGLVGLLNDGRTFTRYLLNPTPSIAASTTFGAKNQPAVWTVGCQFTHFFDVITDE